MAEASDYTYQVSWSKEDEEYVGTCAEFPLLSYCGKEVVETFDGIVEVVVSALDILKEEGQKIPAPFGTHCYSY